jgi:hypothetical protein
MNLPNHSVFSHQGVRVLVLAGMLTLPFASQAIDFGPQGEFSLTGFAEETITMQGAYCGGCQVAASGASRQVRASDAIIPGKQYGDATLTNWQVQPYLGYKRDIGEGYKVSALLSQRWRRGGVNGVADATEVRYGGTVDVPDYWYEKNIALAHEDWGSVRIGSMTTRSWSVADYPYGTQVGLASAWSSSGAGYGMLGSAVRLGSVLLDVADGDLFLEATYDQGNTNFTRLKPEFWELYAQYHRGDLVVDAMLQDAKNGGPGAWGHAPFSSVTPFAVDDMALQYDGTGVGAPLKGNQQNIAMLMARYQASSQLEVSGGLRYNYWSGANSVYSVASNWTTAFNADFKTTAYTGYAASSYDALLGARYRTGPWMFYTGMVYLGSASTGNPSQRGQGNSARINTLGANYDFGRGLMFGSTLGVVHYAYLGLAPLSMPGNAAFSNVDSRITQDGRWLTLGFVYAF